jgi:branched-chain amino acid transport system permease protein
MSNMKFIALLIVAGAATFAAMLWIGNPYVFFAGYVVLQYIVLATAWNILGGYTGYVNFGVAAFFACGAYSTVVLHKLWGPPLIVLIVVGGAVSGLIGLGTGYLTMRLRGTFFGIATLAMSVVAQTLITNWPYVGACFVAAARLHPISLPDDAGAVGGRAGHRTRHRAFAAGRRLRNDPR